LPKIRIDRNIEYKDLKDLNEFNILGQAIGLANVVGADKVSIRFEKDKAHDKAHLQIDAYKGLYGDLYRRGVLRYFPPEEDKKKK